jgi:hypothetical protein
VETVAEVGSVYFGNVAYFLLCEIIRSNMNCGRTYILRRGMQCVVVISK